jgi:hypothetical protein
MPARPTVLAVTHVSCEYTTMFAPLDLAAETPQTISATARQFPPMRAGRPVHPATVVRWITVGVRGPDGGRVRLEAARLGGRWITTAQAVKRFIAALSAVTGAAPVSVPRTPAQRHRAAERAGAALDKLGI